MQEHNLFYIYNAQNLKIIFAVLHTLVTIILGSDVHWRIAWTDEKGTHYVIPKLFNMGEERKLKCDTLDLITVDMCVFRLL